MDENARFFANQGFMPRPLRQLQDAFLERFLCSDRAVPADLEAARYWRSGAH